MRLSPILRLACVFIGISSSLGAQRAASDSIAVVNAHQQWFRGLLTHDTLALSAVLAPDVTLAFPGGNTMPRADFLGYLQGGQLFYDSANHEDLRVRVYSSAAVVTGRSTLAYRFQGSAGSERLAYTATYVRSASGWRMVAWQSTVSPAPKAPKP